MKFVKIKDSENNMLRKKRKVKLILYNNVTDQRCCPILFEEESRVKQDHLSNLVRPQKPGSTVE